ncbi:tRNA pseudouridine(38/39) synthase [Nakaseomyces bracarensis]|uniref:tRNA pseudouridine(38/39) synthase n=1 Tax=Nakaseomyces bracarensis TaxID=273131 RepID=A0ABR4NXK6_9SACH
MVLGILRKIFKPAGTGGKVTKEVRKRVEYADWDKEKLIERILELESSNNTITKTIKQDPQPSKKGKKGKKVKKFDFSKYNTRFIALRFAYLGWNYNGLAIQKEVTPLPTVEGTILEAMNKCKLVPSMVPQEYKFSRCGRTDKGVSAMNQVISLRVRSNLTDEEQLDPANDCKEIQYINILNQLLPDDIRISAVCLRPPKDFDARFSCEYRHYKYLFHKEGLDLEKMQKAAKLYEGEHDFRNFCKLDGSKQITNYFRTIKSANIKHVYNDFYCFDLIGSAFLWHQVRCMTAILFLIGQGLEEPELINAMIDISTTPQKPIYEMANDIPLLLYDCKFPDMEWLEANLDDYKSIKYGKAVSSLALDYHLKSTVVEIFKNTLPKNETNLSGKVRINLGDGKGKVLTNYEKILDRDVMAPVDEVNKKYIERKKRNSKQSLNK